MEQKHCLDKKLTIAIDVDGVLRNNLGIMVDLYNKEFNDNKTVDEITDYRTEIMFPRIEAETGKTASQWFFQDHSKEIFEDAAAYPHVMADIRRLQTIADVIIVTYQKSYTNKLQALKWLENNGIEPNGICFLKDKTKILADYLVDDNNWNFIGSNVTHGILVDAPYNKSININEILGQSNCKTIERVSTFHEFVEHILKTETEA